VDFPAHTTTTEMPNLAPGQETFLSGVQAIMEELVKNEAEGPLKDLALYQIQNPGKKLRSKLIYNLALTLGTDKLEEISLWAAANELIHEATLIHDDIQDDDETRRGKPALWKVCGAAQAINAGDFLLLLSIKPLLKLGSLDLIELHNKTSFQLAVGQAHEIHQKDSGLMAENSFYIHCIEKKTASLFSSLAQGVGKIYGLDELSVKQLGEVFLKLGCIFQMQDDILDLYGDKGRDVCGCDIKEGKMSFLIHTHFIHHPEDRISILNLLAKEYEKTSQKDIESLKLMLIEKRTLELCLDNLRKEIQALKTFAKSTNPFQNKIESINQFVSYIVKPIEHLLD
jgi:geranylgeranyl diphosphate synthase type I